ncbi:MAG TPA: metal ABC transporter ATP-binding protein [Saprospiraceae bacterium]|nr:metal ABC transporter ATP-binding protein [Saprospiraceae bacterium]
MIYPISVEGLSVSYDKKRVLTNVYLHLEEGKVIGVLGPNGAGKSTLFKAILGLLDQNSGTVKIFGKDISESRRRIAYVPQRDEVDWSFPATVKDVVMMGRYPAKNIWQRMDALDHQKAAEAMEELSITDLAKRQIGALSGGQQQRVFLARALCQEADILLLDEPFVGVDITTEEHIIRVLRKLSKEGKTLLVVHHDLATVKEYFDQVILINQRVIAYGDTDTTFIGDNIAKAYGAQHTIELEAGH